MRSFWSGIRLRVPGVTLALCVLGQSGFVLAGQTAPEPEKEQEPIAVAAKPTYRLARINTPPVIDGVVEETWKEAKIETEFFEVAPQPNVPSELRTVAYLAYDDKHLYFAFQCFDQNPKTIRANSGRDKIFVDDIVGVYVDPLGNGIRAYEFLVNPRGVQMDAIRTEGQPEDFLWDAAWASSARITEHGWEAEGKVPLNTLRLPKKPLQSWKFLLVRIHPTVRGRLNIANFKMVYGNPCLICQWPDIAGPEGIQPGRNLSMTSTLTSYYTDRPFQLRGHKDAAANPGADIKWGINPTTEVEITANPDFSQIESDVNQLAVNNRFVISFPERRPFFLEANDAFAARGVPGGFVFLGIPGGIANGNSGAPLNLFYSRSIAKPIVAAKMSRRTQGSQLSVLWAVDDLPTIIVADANRSTTFQLPYQSVDTVARYRIDMLKNASVAFGVTDMRFNGGHSTVVSSDVLLRPFRNVDIAGQFAHSDANALGTESLLEAFDLFSTLSGRRKSANALSLQAGARGRSYNVQAGYTDIGRDFRADLGILQQTDLRTFDTSGNWQWIPDTHPVFVRVGPALRFVNSVNHQGFLMERTSYLGVQGLFRGMTFFRAHHVFGDQTVGGIQFRDLKRIIAEFHSRPARWVTPINFTVISGDLVDVVNVQRGRGYSLGVGATFRPTPQLSLANDTSREYLRREDTGAEIYHAQIARLNATYQLTPRTSLRSILQYSYVDRDPHQYIAPVLERSHALNSFLLLAYRLRPQTTLYMGYNDSFVGPEAAADFDATHPITDRNHPQNGGSCTVDASVGPAGFQGNGSGLAGQATTSRCRTVFLKISHTFGF